MSESTATAPASRDRESARRGNPITRVVTYVRQVVAELRKVIWPTRTELITYTSVVLVFVVVMGLIVSAFDFVFAKGVLAVFGK
ncbi:MAG: preprotein translocase subunit SecE [Frankiales bacterium]|nr:preprotein translocase subunit SecE [Frankiales bacterium]